MKRHQEGCPTLLGAKDGDCTCPEAEDTKKLMPEDRKKILMDIVRDYELMVNLKKDESVLRKAMWEIHRTTKDADSLRIAEAALRTIGDLG